MARYERQDRFFHRAKQDQYVARSVYKLDELDRRYRLVSKGDAVVDLGCAPGSWLQYLGEKVGKKGLALGYDLEPVTIPLAASVTTHVADVFDLTPERVLDDAAAAASRDEKPPKMAALLSDMAPKLTGIRDADQARSVHLVEWALRLARGLFEPGRGVFVAKLFQGRDTDGLVAEVKQAFREVKLLKPEATREGSREVFVLGRTLRPEGRLGPDAFPARAASRDDEREG